MSDPTVHHLGAAYALDALDERERAAYESHYLTCDICRVDVAEFRAAAADMATLSATPAPSAVKARVMAQIDGTRQLSPLASPVTGLRGTPGVTRIVLAAAAALVIFLAGAVLFGGRSGDSFGDQLEAMATEPDFGLMALEGDGVGTVKLAFTSERAAVIGDGLPDPGPDNRYELWMLDDRGAHPTRMLDPADNGEVRRIVDVSGSPTGWGITIEPKGGSATPTMPVLFLGTT